jgi:hypothetical protein
LRSRIAYPLPYYDQEGTAIQDKLKEAKGIVRDKFMPP